MCPAKASSRKSPGNENLGMLLAFAAAIISGAAITANKLFIVNIDPVVFTSIRSLVIGIIFLLIILIQSRFDFPGTLRTLRKADWRYMIAIAVIGGAAAFLLFFSGLKLTTSGRASFIHKTMPIYIAVFSYWFLKEKISMKQTYALIIMLLGTVLIFGSDIAAGAMWANPLLGDALILAATVFWAAENILAKKVMSNGDTNWMVSFSRMFVGALILFGFAGLTGKIGLVAALTTQQLANIAISTAILFGYVFTWYYSLRFINVSKASMILMLSPVITLLLGISVLGEPAPFVQMLGSALILFGLYAVSKIKSEMVTGA
jgi:drug/metabolite transporter (DMT)-like permease